jgi:hypothetical protein
VAETWQPPEFARPPFDQLAHHADLLGGVDWPTLGDLSSRLHGLVHPVSGAPLAFIAQDQALFRDGLHYERRIHDHGRIATRPASWHDLYGALAWIDWPRTKLALNRLQVEDLAVQGRGNRTRRQQSLTHIDEAGLMVAASDPGLLAAIQAHDWQTVFIRRRAAWGREIVVHVFGHALYELARTPHLTLAGKGLLFHVDTALLAASWCERVAILDAAAAAAILDGRLAADPRDQPSLPLSGVPGWRAGNDDPAFIAHAECFRPAPVGRVYAPWVEMRAGD